jgi:hypothetical protein
MGFVMVLVILAGVVLLLLGLISPKAVGMPRASTAKLSSVMIWGGLIGLFFFPLTPEAPPAAANAAAARPAAIAAPAQPAPAQVAERPAPRPRGPDRLVNEAGEFVPVWRSSESMSEGIRLIQAGVHRSNASLLMPLVACLAPNRSRVVRVEPGFFSSTVLVTEGPQSGCRGVVVNEMISDAV